MERCDSPLNGGAIIACYEQILALTLQKLDAARNSDWDEVVVLEEKRTDVIGSLKSSDRNDLLDDLQISKKAELIRDILASDLEGRTLTEEWMAELKNILGSLGTEMKLSNAYERAAGS